jgi:hypothetical protein
MVAGTAWGILAAVGYIFILLATLACVIAIYKFGVFPGFRSLRDDRRKRRESQAENRASSDG